MIGTQIGNYQITGQIGEGGMGAVYSAKHTMLDKTVAVKVLLPQVSNNAEIVSRFFNEAKATTMIKDPGIVELYDFGHLADGSAYIVMELLTGEGMDVRMSKTGRIPYADAARLVRRIASVLSAAHSHGIVHRDLKPENIFLVPDRAVEGGERPKVLDFGIAKLGGGLESSTGSNVRTRTGAIIGSPLYMSPEQCKGAGQVDHRADIYSLGCMLFELLCGVPPFNGEGAGEVLAAHIHVVPPNPQSLEPSVPASLANVVLRTLAKNPEARYGSMDELSAVLQRFCSPTQPGNDDEVAHTAPVEIPMALVAETLAPMPLPNAILGGGRAFPAGSVHISESGTAHPYANGSLHSAAPPATGKSLQSAAPPAAYHAAQLAVGPIAASRFPVPTTLGGAATDTTAHVQPAAAHRGVTMVLMALMLAVAGGIGYRLLSTSESDKEPIIRASETPAPTEVPKEVPVTIAASDAAPLTVAIRIETEPEAAGVYDTTNKLIGVTPFDYRGDRGEGQVVFLLTHKGFHDRTVEFSLKQDATTNFELTARPSRSRMSSAQKAREKQRAEMAAIRDAETGRVEAEHGRTKAELMREAAAEERQRRAEERHRKVEASEKERLGDGVL